MGRSRHRRQSGVLARVWRRNQPVAVPAPRFPEISVTDGLTRMTHTCVPISDWMAFVITANTTGRHGAVTVAGMAL
jgi:hypothetical protein